MRRTITISGIIRLNEYDYIQIDAIKYKNGDKTYEISVFKDGRYNKGDFIQQDAYYALISLATDITATYEYETDYIYKVVEFHIGDVSRKPLSISRYTENL